MSRLWVKLTLAFLIVALAAVGVVALAVSRATRNEFRQYVVRSNMMIAPQAVEALTAYYETQGDWDDVEALLSNLGPGQGMGMMGGRRGMGFRLTLADADGRVVADPVGELVGQHLSSTVLALGAPLEVDGQRVGTLLTLATTDLVLDDAAQAFLDAMRRALLWASLAALALALLLGLLYSRWLTAPLQRMRAAAGAIASGDLSQRVAVAGQDEIGELGAAFNGMAANLQEADAQRQRLMADVAHELRTPLAVIQGNLQAMLDGVYPLDQAQIANLYDETRLLTRLVDDLHDLAQAEAGQLRIERAPVDLRAIVRGAAANFAAPAEAAGLTLKLGIGPDPIIVSGDADRLGQVLRNLMGNALRHTPAGGEIAVNVSALQGSARLTVSDTGAGIAPEDLPHVFDRFYRADKSRSRRGGGAGLGLAIAGQIVRAHGGEITVQSAPGQGAAFTVVLPMT